MHRVIEQVKKQLLWNPKFAATTGFSISASIRKETFVHPNRWGNQAWFGR
jgi:hypothetical protein